jgi:hypothetical protein
MMTVNEVAVMVEACDAVGTKTDLGHRAGARTGDHRRVLLVDVDKLIKLDYLRINPQDKIVEPTSRGRQELRLSIDILEKLVRDGNLLRYQ